MTPVTWHMLIHSAWVSLLERGCPRPLSDLPSPALLPGLFSSSKCLHDSRQELTSQVYEAAIMFLNAAGGSRSGDGLNASPTSPS
jgi:hypothetical protein